MKSRNKKFERGQSLVLVALLFLAFVAILALVLDGGVVYAARRQAQNAADSGALAGATYLCSNKDQVGIKAIAEGVASDYAVLNGAVDPAEADANLGDYTMTVTTTVDTQPFFAGLIGFSDLSPRATAKAQCQPPSGIGIMPVAWSCRKPVTGEEGETYDPKELGCAMNFGPCWDDGQNGLSCTYIFMDSVKVKNNQGTCNNPQDADNPDCYEQNDVVCDDPETEGIDPGTIDCDLNDDGIIDLMTGGARSWLDLNGPPGGGAAELKSWIQNGFPGLIEPFTWLPEQAGVTTSIFQDVGEYLVGDEATLPVFDKLCPKEPYINTDPSYSLEACTWNDYDDRSKEGVQLNFHIVAFSRFYVTCVQTGKNRVWSVPELNLKKNESCPGHAKAVEVGSIRDNDKSIEGYFLEGETIYGYGSSSGDWVNVGTFTVVLVE
jgi:hypothetical protein